MEKYLIVRKTKKGLQIGQNKYSFEKAKERANQMRKLGLKAKVSSVTNALGV